MLSSALRVGFGRVSNAAKRRLLPTINAGILYVVILDYSLIFRRQCSRGTCRCVDIEVYKLHVR